MNLQPRRPVLRIGIVAIALATGCNALLGDLKDRPSDGGAGSNSEAEALGDSAAASGATSGTAGATSGTSGATSGTAGAHAGSSSGGSGSGATGTSDAAKPTDASADGGVDATVAGSVADSGLQDAGAADGDSSGDAGPCTDACSGSAQECDPACGPHQTCAGAATGCVCVTDPVCVSTAAACMGNKVVTCARDSQGCLYQSSSAACSGGGTCEGGACVCPSGTLPCGSTCEQPSAQNGCGTSCTTPCPTPANGAASCDGVACSITCNQAYSACNGACVNELTDNNNCGGCGLTCSTGCSNGQCVVVVSEQGSSGVRPIQLIAAGAYAYWTGQGDAAWLFDAPLAGGAATVLYNDNELLGIGSLWNLPGGVYAPVLTYPARVYEILAFGAPSISADIITPIGSSDVGSPMAGDSTNVYWVDSASTPSYSLMEVPKLGAPSSTTMYTQSAAITALGVDSSNIYFSDSAGIHKMGLTSNSPSLIASSSAAANFMTVVGGTVYWVTNNANVLSASVAGGAVSTLTTGQTMTYVTSDADGIYWMNTTAIYALPFATGAATLLYSPPTGEGITSSFGNGCGLGVSGSSLYWLSGKLTSGANVGAYQLMSLTPK